jgi:hypothetical protein
VSKRGGVRHETIDVDTRMRSITGRVSTSTHKGRSTNTLCIPQTRADIQLAGSLSDISGHVQDLRLARDLGSNLVLAYHGHHINHGL